MKISIVIAAHNAGDTIGVQLEALAKQEWDGSWEVIISDNGSNDDTLKVAECYSERLPRLQIVDSSERKGAGHARNVGANAAAGDVLLFVDADDEVAPGWLRAMVQSLQKHDFVACRLDGTKLNNHKSKMRTCPQSNGLQDYPFPPFLQHAGGGTLGVKKTAHFSVNGFDEDFYKLQDTDYCWRLQLAGYKLHFAGDALVNVRYRDNLSATFRQAREWGEHNVKLYKVYRPLGMPKISWKQGVRNWCELLLSVVDVAVPEKRDEWLWRLNWNYGRFVGCLKYRVFAP